MIILLRVKICGITNLEDAISCADLGVDAIGFVFYKDSPRYISYEKAWQIIQKLPPFICTVGVFVNESPSFLVEIKKELSLSYVQPYFDDEKLYGVLAKFIDPRAIIRPYRITDNFQMNKINSSEYFPLLEGFSEKYGGVGAKFNWEKLTEISVPFILAGGINLENVENVLKYKPYAIDISSGVEAYPGKKDEQKIKAILRRIGRNV
ncbi:MAG: phosphoribosylanthranilate isomerase [Fervidobacterium sp.]|nr:phosphoribosylanthranilate isomerase [Fervidobacterium sp.]